MSAPYNGVAANATGTVVSATVPADGDIDNASILNAGTMNLADWGQRLADIALNLGATQLSSSSSSFSTTSGTLVDVTNLTATLTVHGRPVLVLIQPDGSGSAAFFANTGATVSFDLQRDGSTIAAWECSFGAGNEVPMGFPYVDVPSAGSHTYKVKASVGGGATLTIANFKLRAVEL